MSELSIPEEVRNAIEQARNPKEIVLRDHRDRFQVLLPIFEPIWDKMTPAEKAGITAELAPTLQNQTIISPDEAVELFFGSKRRNNSYQSNASPFAMKILRMKGIISDGDVSQEQAAREIEQTESLAEQISGFPDAAVAVALREIKKRLAGQTPPRT